MKIRWKDPGREKRWLAGVSGGPDSMALLDFLHARGYDVTAAHVDYHARRSSGRDREIVRKYCEEKKIPLRILDAEYPGKGNFEAWAREVRYRFYREIVQEDSLDGVLLGHQQDDLLETWMMQREKGASYSFWGLREEGDVEGVRVFRPLLGNSKEDLLQYCRENSVPWGIDETNLRLDRARNRIRKQIVETADAGTRERWLREIDRMNREEEKREREDARDVSCLLDSRLDAYGSYSPEKRIRLLRKYLLEKGVPEARGLSHKELAQMDRNVRGNRNLRIRRFSAKDFDLDYGVLSVHEKAEEYRYVLEKGEEFRCPQLAVKAEGSPRELVRAREGDWPLTVRSPQRGDSILLGFGEKKLSRWFIDRKIPRYDRERWTVVENAQGLVIFVRGIGASKEREADCPAFFLAGEK